MASEEERTDADASFTEPHGSGARAEWSRHRRPSTAVVEAVAAATGRDVLELPPLAESVDTDALDSLIAVASRRSERSISIAFEYDGLAVTVDSHDGVELGDVRDGGP